MDPTPAEPPPGCLVLLLRLSAGMTADVVTGRGETVAVAAVRHLADELLDGLVNTLAAGYAIGAVDVAVLGYRTGPDGAPQVLSLLPDGDPKPRLVPLTHVVGMPAAPRDAEGQPKKWTVPPACGGDPCPTAALAAAYQMVSVWLTGRFAARPPVVIHCTDTAGLDAAYFRVARSLALLATGHGPVRLLHYVFEAGAEPVPLGTWAAAPEGEPWAELFRTSGDLAENPDAGKPRRRAIAVNDWDIGDPWDALFAYEWRGDTVAWTGSGGFGSSRALWVEKMGNTPEQWEDAYAVDAPGGAAAIADGASSGIYCSIWAQQLSQRFLADRPDAREPIALNKWVNGLRAEWRAAINYNNLNWSKQAKVDQVGAAATLLTLEIGPEADGERPWRAAAVGDASLFWVRGGRLLGTFPVAAADQFGSAPLLVRSNPGFRTLAVAAAGTCRPGDRFVLATDAVAARLLKSSAGPGPEWDRFETMTADDWRAELDTLRRSKDMVNDDCTLVVLCVAGAETSGGREPPEAIGEDNELEDETPLANEHASPEATGAESELEEPLASDEPPADEDASPVLLQAPAEGEAREEADVLPSAEELVEQPEPHVEPPPADAPPAARDGFPESTDPRV
ncbi:hypothetical protein [Frigoriglobus tundricola]|uniref:PPM-type phosphatase domain-containing protein n=1 Tax=Frigoriglobus tundricola TaxID=2774151 RepID=A0A6M5YRR3_9BACT|nr:hypothetical protein [Frigoriglobus tundricola]QJW96777.1 hypothetical protein FTUN_4336 [Frigoriglobus tundricola]